MMDKCFSTRESPSNHEADSESCIRMMPSPGSESSESEPIFTWRFSEKRSSLTAQRCLIFLLILLIIATAVFLALFLVYFFKYEDRVKLEVCDSVNCVKSAAMLAEKMDATVDPCEDFAEYACGNFIKTAVFAEGETVKSSFTVLNDANREVLKSILTEETKAGDPDYMVNMKNLYQSCVDEAKIEEIGLQPFLNTSYAKDWPTLIGQNWPGEATFNLNEVMIRYMERSVEPIFSYTVTTDIMDSSRNTIWLIDPSLGLSRKYLTRPRNDSILQAYENYLTHFAIILGADPTVAAQDAAAYVDLEMELSNITAPQEDRRDYFKMYNPTTLGALKTNYSYLEIAAALRAGFSVAGMTLSDDQDITVLFPRYFEKLQAVLDRADKRALMNLFGFKFALARVGGLTKQLRDIQLEWQRVYVGKQEETPRWKTCLGQASNTFQLAIAKEYTAQKFSEDSKQYMNVMIDHLKESFRNILREATWMSDDTKEEAYQKLDRMDRKIGYPDTNFDAEYFAKKYENLTMTPDNYYRNKRTVFWDWIRQLLLHLTKPKDKNEWVMAPYAVNAYYSMVNNEIAFPAGILQAPFFSDIFPDAINYGAIGMVIGHEITHGFDDQGKQYDKDGNLRKWWQPDDETRFKDKTKCIVEQYGNFRDESVGLNVNGINTQGENVADNGGLKESYSAYKKLVQEKGESKKLPGLGLTNDQLFFLGFAQLWCNKQTKQVAIVNINNGVHSPGRFRIMGTMQNSPEFAEAYKCPVGSTMNPEKKCNVW